ncbi:amidohydrolase family protein [Candidatus Margulisiibacteriota bacterium]
MIVPVLIFAVLAAGCYGSLKTPDVPKPPEPAGDDDTVGDDDTAGDDDNSEVITVDGMTVDFVNYEIVEVDPTDDDTGDDDTIGDDDTGDDDVEPYDPSEYRYVIEGTLGAPIIITGGIVVTANVSGEIEVIENGEARVEDNRIACVGEAGACSETDETGEPTIVHLAPTDKIYPGLIDTHNHHKYSPCGLFTHPGTTYTHSAQWRGSDEYGLWKDNCADLIAEFGLICEANQHGLTRSTIGGATATQSAPNNRCLRESQYIPLLGRDIDYVHGFGPDLPDINRANVLGPGSYSDEEAQNICAQQATDGIGLISHSGEGHREDPHVIAELEVLRTKADGCLLNPQTLIIHGNWDLADELAAAACDEEAGECSPDYLPRFVWSPSSNTDLYGWQMLASLPVADLLDYGVIVALAPDWICSHGIGMITELNVAREFISDFLSTEFPLPDGSTTLIPDITDEDLFLMATHYAAIAANLGDRIGRLQENLAADITIVTGLTDYPYETAFLGNIAGVMVGGQWKYGDDWLMPAARLYRESPDNCEDLEICDVSKKICIPETLEGDRVRLSELTFAGLFDLQPFDALPGSCF